MSQSNGQATAAWNGLFAIALVAILVSGFVLVRPKPAEKPKAPPLTVEGVRKQTEMIEARLGPAKDEIKSRTWNLTPEVFDSTGLQLLTKLAERHHLQLVGFHVARAISAADIQEAPIEGTVEGGFLDVLGLLKDVEQPETKLAINMLHISANGGGDRVHATLGLTGFLSKEGA